MRSLYRDQRRGPQESAKSTLHNEKMARCSILCPISVSNGRRPLLVEIQPHSGSGGKLHGNMQKENDLPSYEHNLIKLKMVFVDRAGTTTTSTTTTLSSPFSPDTTSSLPSPISSHSEHSPLPPFFPDDSYDANEVLENDRAHSLIKLDAKEHNKIPVETGNCRENTTTSSKESYSLSGDCTNDISRARYFQDLSEYGANLIKLKREIELIQHIQKNSKVITFEVDWRMKKKRLTRKMHLADREENIQRLYTKSRMDYRMEGKRRREDVEQKLEKREKGFRIR